MREVVQPITRRVFEGEACRVVVGLVGESVSVAVCPRVQAGLTPPAAFDLMTPEVFASLASDLAEMASSVQKAAREMLRDAREPVAVGRETT